MPYEMTILEFGWMREYEKKYIMKNQITFYRILVLVGLLLWWGENYYFEFNSKPINGIEKGFDITAQVFLWWGIIGDITHNLTIKKDTIITTNTVEIKSLVPSEGRNKG